MGSSRNIDLQALTVEEAKTLVDKVFTVAVNGNEYQLKLFEVGAIEIRAGRRARLPKRPPFSLFFLGPRDPILPQAMYKLTNDEVSFESLFIVPVGSDEEGTEYEAVFA